MKLTVIMSVYNAQETVARSIESILNQDYKEFEFLIADDGSTDRSMEIIDSFEDKRIITQHNNKNLGLLRTWNKLLDLANGQYIIFQDADDTSLGGRLFKLVSFMERNPEVAVCGSNFRRVFRKYNKTIVSNYPNSKREIMASLDEGRVPFIRGIFKTSIVREMGKFRSFFDRIGWEDYDLFLRIAEKYEVANISDVLYEYAYYDSSSSKLDLNNLSAKKVFVHDIGLLLHAQRVDNDGIDGLSNPKLMLEVDRFVEQKERFLKRNPTYVYRKKIKNQLSNMDYGNAFDLCAKAIQLQPLVIENYVLLLKCLAHSVKNYTQAKLKR